jgi:hypothetical protein
MGAQHEQAEAGRLGGGTQGGENGVHDRSFGALEGTTPVVAEKSS